MSSSVHGGVGISVFSAGKEEAVSALPCSAPPDSSWEGSEKSCDSEASGIEPPEGRKEESFGFEISGRAAAGASGKDGVPEEPGLPELSDALPLSVTEASTEGVPPPIPSIGASTSFVSITGTAMITAMIGSRTIADMRPDFFLDDFFSLPVYADPVK